MAPQLAADHRACRNVGILAGASLVGCLWRGVPVVTLIRTASREESNAASQVLIAALYNAFRTAAKQTKVSPGCLVPMAVELLAHELCDLDQSATVMFFDALARRMRDGEWTDSTEQLRQTGYERLLNTYALHAAPIGGSA